MPITSISEANAQLSALIERVLAGEEVIIGKAGKPVAKLVRFERPRGPRRPGALRGRIEIAKDFDELPDDLRQVFGRSSVWTKGEPPPRYPCAFVVACRALMVS